MKKMVVLYGIVCCSVCFLSGCDFQHIQYDLKLAVCESLREITDEYALSRALVFGYILPCCHNKSNPYHFGKQHFILADDICIEGRSDTYGSRYSIHIKYSSSDPFSEFGELIPTGDFIWVDINNEGMIRNIRSTLIDVRDSGVPDKLLSKIKEHYHSLRSRR